MRGARTGIAMLLTAICMAGCAGPTPGAGPRGSSEDPRASAGPRRVTTAIMGDPGMLNRPFVASGTGGVRGLAEAELLIHAGTAVLAPDGRLRSQLAVAIPTIENGGWRLFADGRMETTWQLRPDARWHDGTPVTAADLIFTAQIGNDKELSILRNPAFDSLDTVVVDDERTVTVRWSRPYTDADRMFTAETMLPFPKHLAEATYLTNKAALFELPLWVNDYVGAGPFRLKEFVRNSHLTLSAFDGYVLGRPKLDEIVVRFIIDPNALIANLLAGEVEMTVGRGLSLEQGIQVGEQWRSGRLETSPSSWIAHYPQLLTPSPAVIGDVRFRRALTHGVDRQQMSDALQAGLAPVAHGWVELAMPEFAEVEASIVKYGYDPRQALQLMEEVGLTRAGDGTIRDAAGQRVVIESRTNAGDDLKDKMLFSSADFWKRLGLEVEIVVVPRQQADDRQYRATFPGFDLVRQPFEPERYLTSEAPLPENGFRGKNRTRYMNAEYDALSDRYFTTIPWGQRMEVLRELVHHVTDRVLAIGLLYGPRPTLISNRLANVQAPQAPGSSETWNAHEWDVK